MSRAAQDPRLNRRLTKAVENPYLALEKGWYQQPEFCRGFFDRCEHLALVSSPATLELAQRAVHIAESHGDPHLINRSYGVLAHAHIARFDLFLAGKVLQDCRDLALACCPRCRSDYLRRQGDLLGELRKPDEALEALSGALDDGGRHLDPDARARILFLRGIANYWAGHRDRSIADADRSLRLLSLDSPRGYFHDNVSCLAIYAAGGGRRQDALALAHVDRVLERIRGLDGWKVLRTRSCWVKGHLHARLGDLRRARTQLERAQVRLLTEGLLREAVAVVLDNAQLRCRHPEPRGDNLLSAQLAVAACLKRPDLTDKHRRGLEEMAKVLEKHPEKAFDELGAFRRSFIAPVPGILGERIGPG